MLLSEAVASLEMGSWEMLVTGFDLIGWRGVR
jgi:hypothetical protein